MTDVRSGRVRVRVGDETTVLAIDDGRSSTLPIGVRTLTDDELAGPDPPKPEQLSNAIGLVEDHVEDVVLAHPDLGELVSATTVLVAGPVVLSVARVELGHDDVPTGFVLSRPAAEDVFRTVATERRIERLHNPGLPSEHVDTIVAGCCLVVGLMRKLQLDRVEVAES
jgi:exopolyphosphatase / guanosine-5'-triphosphate,3'-diphosphate pyrophosphatase